MSENNKITKLEVERLVKLARIEIPKDKTEKYVEQLNKIVDFVSQLDELDLDDVEPLYHVLEQQNSGREDVVQKSLNHKDLLENAPDTKDLLFRVPPVIIGKKKSR